jgi:hypothetical protein
MRLSTRLAALAGALFVLPLAAGASAQEDETAYVYASYYQCSGGLNDAIATLRDDWGPIVQSHMDADHISAWGVLTHATGNPWTMAIYHVGPEIGALNTALDQALATYFEQHPEEGAQFGENCPTHEDYIWTTGLGSEPGAAVAQDRTTAGMSVYWVCDEGKEAVADLIVENVWAPIYDQQVTDGLINSWGWLSHFVGGEYRRLLVVDGADHSTLLEARNQALEATGAENAALAAAFSDVCNGHTDILWDIAISVP